MDGDAARIASLYAMQERRPFGFTLSHSISPLLPLVLLWLLCVVLRGPAWPRFERVLIATAAALSLLALLAQGKALPYQRYPMLAFLLLLIALDLMTAWREGANALCVRYVAWAGVCYGCLVLAPLALVKVHRFVAKPQEFDAMLAADLRNCAWRRPERARAVPGHDPGLLADAVHAAPGAGDGHALRSEFVRPVRKCGGREIAAAIS